MHIIIEEVLAETPQGAQVSFTSPLGTGRGLWWSYNPPPQIGESYDVEMDILDDLVLGDHIEVLEDIDDTPDAYRLEWHDGHMLIQGKIDTIAGIDGGIIAISVDVKSRDSNVVFTLDFPTLSVYRYKVVRIHAREIGLADTNI
jgi:hypothetical protein